MVLSRTVRLTILPPAKKPDFYASPSFPGSFMRTDYCGLIDAKYIDQTVTLYGWVHRRRDREGVVQVVCDPDNPVAFETAEKVRNEYVLKVSGLVRHRPEGTVNSNLVSGEIEVLIHSLEILNASLPPPFLMDDEHLSESVR